MPIKSKASAKFDTYVSLVETSTDTFAEANAASSNGRLFKGVTILKSGLGNRKDKHLYTPKAMKEAVQEGLFNDLRAFVDHPTSIDEQVQPERTVRDLIGVYRNPRFVESGNGSRVVADLHILEPHAWLAKGIRELVDMGLGDKVGISILGSGKTSPTKYREGTEEMEVSQVDKFLKLRSADIVTQAGAGGGFNNLLESAREGREQSDMKDILKQIEEAAKAGDATKVQELSAKLAETNKDSAETETETSTETAEVEENKADKKAEDSEDAADNESDEADEAEESYEDPTQECGKMTMKEKGLPGAGNKTGSLTKKMGKKKPVGKPFGEAEGDNVETAELNQLRESVAALEAENTTLKAQAKTRSLMGHIAKALKEAKLPEKSKSKLYGKLASIGDVKEINAEIAFQEALFADLREARLSEFEEVEGAGSSQGETDGANAQVARLTEAITGSGLKLKAAKQ